MRSHRARLERLKQAFNAGRAAGVDERLCRLLQCCYGGHDLSPEEEADLAAHDADVRAAVLADYGPLDAAGRYTSDPLTKALQQPLLPALPAHKEQEHHDDPDDYDTPSSHRHA